MINNQNKKLVYCHINGNCFFILAVSYVSNFHIRDNSRDLWGPFLVGLGCLLR